MYEIGPNKAATDLYGVGKGNAQVFDLSTAERGIAHRQAQEQAKKTAQAKKDAAARKRATDLMNNRIGEIHPADVDAFKAKGSEYRKAVLDAFKEGGGDISIEKEAELNQMYANMNQQSLASKNRFGTEKGKMAQIHSPTGKYRDRAKSKAYESFHTSSFGDDGSFDPSDRVDATATFDLDGKVGKLVTNRVKTIDANKKMGKTDWSVENAAEDARSIVDDPLARREVYEQLVDMSEDGSFQDYITEVYTSEFDEAGYPNPSYRPDGVPAGMTIDNVDLGDVAAYRYQKEFAVDGQDPLPKGPYTGPGSTYAEKRPNVYIDPNTNTLETYTGTKSEEALTTKTTYEGEPVLATPPQKIKFNDKGEVIGSQMTIKPSPEQSKENAAIRMENRANEKEFKKKLFELNVDEPPERSTGMFGFGADTDKEYEKKLDAYRKQIAPIRELYPILEEPYPEKSVPLDAAQTKKYYYETWGFPLDEAIKATKSNSRMNVEVETLSSAGTPESSTPESSTPESSTPEADVPEDEARMQAASEAAAKELKSHDYSETRDLRNSKGEVVAAGYKDGVWYNIETGKKLK